MNTVWVLWVVSIINGQPQKTAADIYQYELDCQTAQIMRQQSSDLRAAKVQSPHFLPDHEVFVCRQARL